MYGRWGTKNVLRSGRVTVPMSTGHSPASTRSNDDLPLPLGPMMMIPRPGFTSKLRLLNSSLPSGVWHAMPCTLTTSPSTTSRVRFDISFRISSISSNASTSWPTRCVNPASEPTCNQRPQPVR